MNSRRVTRGRSVTQVFNNKFSHNFSPNFSTNVSIKLSTQFVHQISHTIFQPCFFHQIFQPDCQINYSTKCPQHFTNNLFQTLSILFQHHTFYFMLDNVSRTIYPKQCTQKQKGIIQFFKL